MVVVVVAESGLPIQTPREQLPIDHWHIRIRETLKRINWDWNENLPFPVLWPLVSCPDLLAY